jgi:protein TonB
VETLKGKISASWYNSLVSPGLKGKFTTVVYFRILRNGNISDLELEEESGNNSLDLSSLRAIKDAAPFPPLPSDFPGQYLGVHFEFEWEK